MLVSAACHRSREVRLTPTKLIALDRVKANVEKITPTNINIVLSR
jgi:hypothetical protein